MIPVFLTVLEAWHSYDLKRPAGYATLSKHHVMVRTGVEQLFESGELKLRVRSGAMVSSDHSAFGVEVLGTSKFRIHVAPIETKRWTAGYVFEAGKSDRHMLILTLKR